jgi:hypothetical protein
MTGVEQQFPKLEGEIREFVRRDSASMRRAQRNEVDIAAEPSTENLDALIRHVAGASAEEIDRVILELQGVRDMLRGEGERVSQDVMSYGRLSEAAMSAMKVVNGSLKKWKDGPSDPLPANGGMPNDHAS